MPKIGKESVKAGDREKFFKVEFDVNVSAGGVFYTTLKESDVEYLKNCNVDLERNPNAKDKYGYFSSETRSGLISEVKKVVEKAMSRELLSTSTVLRYAIHSTCSFGFTQEGEIVPNLRWTEDGPLDNERYWQNGTRHSHAADPEPTAISLYVVAMERMVYKYADGSEKVEYSQYTPFGSSEVEEGEDHYYLRWIEGICSSKPHPYAKLNEIPYTKERAKFFVEMYKGLSRLALLAAKLEKPDNLELFIEQGGSFKLIE